MPEGSKISIVLASYLISDCQEDFGPDIHRDSYVKNKIGRAIDDLSRAAYSMARSQGYKYLG